MASNRGVSLICLAAQMRAEAQEAGEAFHHRQPEPCRRRRHGKRGKQRRGPNSRREQMVPLERIAAADIRETLSQGFSGEQKPTEQCRRLYRHADAFGDDRMRLAGTVADAEYAIGVTVADTRPDRTGG